MGAGAEWEGLGGDAETLVKCSFADTMEACPRVGAGHSDRWWYVMHGTEFGR